MSFKQIIFASLLGFPLLPFAQPLELEWVAEYPCLGPNSLEYDKIVTDEHQNVYLCGAAASSMSPLLYSTAILTLKYDSIGSLVWESKFDNLFTDKFKDCTFSGSGGLLIAGQRGSLPGSDPPRAEVVKYEVDSGEELWHTFIFDTIEVGASLHDIVLDGAGNIYAFGAFNNSSEIVYDSNKMYVAKVAPDDGEVLWTHIFQKEFLANKGKIMADRIRIFGGRFLGVFDFTNLLVDIDFEGNTIASADLPYLIFENLGPGIYTPYFFFDKEGYLITFGYKVFKFGVSEEPVWSFDFAQSLPNMIGQAMTAVTDGAGDVYATGYLRDTVTLIEYTHTVKLSTDGGLMWANTDKFSDEARFEPGNVIAISDHHTFVCARIWYYDTNGNPQKNDYRLLLYSNEDGSILYDTLIDANVFDAPYFAHYDRGHFYLLGRSYDPWGSGESYKYKLFKFGVDEPVSAVSKSGEESPVSIFPNPTNGHLTISQPSEKRFDKVSLYDVQGRFVFSSELEKAEQALQLPKLPPGVYLVKLSGEAGVFTDLLVVNSF